jgi:hypothetical protein
MIRSRRIILMRGDGVSQQEVAMNMAVNRRVAVYRRKGFRSGGVDEIREDLRSGRKR